MTDKEILDLLRYGERLTLECKKAEGAFQIRFGRRILHLQIQVEA